MAQTQQQPERSTIQPPKQEESATAKPRAPKKPGVILDYERAVIEAAFCRVAAKAGLKVLAYSLKPGEKISGQGEHVRVIVTVDLPRAGQVVFGFAQQQADLLNGLPRTSSATIDLTDLTEQDFEKLVRGALACFPGRIEVSGTIPWNGQDANPQAHAEILANL